MIARLMKMWAERAEEKRGETSSSDDSECEGGEEAFAAGPWMMAGGGPPAHIMEHLMKMSLDDKDEDKNEVKKAEKPNGADENETHGPNGGGMCWKQWMKMGKEPEIWTKVLHLPNISQDEAEVSVKDQKLIVHGVRNDDSSSSDDQRQK